MIALTTNPIAAIAPNKPRGSKPALFRLLDRVAEIDRVYRDRCHLRSLSDEALRDMGLNRSDIR